MDKLNLALQVISNLFPGKKHAPISGILAFVVAFAIQVQDVDFTNLTTNSIVVLVSSSLVTGILVATGVYYVPKPKKDTPDETQ